ncbi:DUF4199 domain-containing protein [Dysgonomonas sp. Marseille-P4677]|uniref:DUF4199 domain-containing protein n=1 Tax=Dysgonomonas sp. Marseille-P4677 TaxID=2364790 RepID=UPI00191474B4|nr:DUF4199 domain-containing protein [Dysgonomonas sp. Marseille-P4677]MBK5719490.1 DUF4199 domain-containing protein [Dysgonomonas sp. Marseille-P4677]
MINNPDIKEKGASLLKYAMHYGMILGVFWMVKYLFLIGSGFSDHVFIYVYYLLNVGTFLLIYIFTFKYKDADPESPKGILSCVLFVTLICFFASFFEAIVIYAHYKFIDPSYFTKMIIPVMNMIEKMPNPSDQKELLGKIFSSQPIYIISEFIKNTMLGLILGLLMGLLVNSTKSK